MKYVLTYLLFVFPTFLFSSKVLPNCDVAFYKNDTLFMEKEFSKIILKKIEKQGDFRYSKNPIEKNIYTAYWEINENGISLLKVTNQTTYNWKILTQNDTLDLKKAFGNKYDNGKVSFKLKNNTLHLHKPFILRQYWSWFPSYLEDYKIEFKKDKIIKFDTTLNYKNDKTRLNRYTKAQLDESVFDLIKDSIKINKSINDAKSMEFSIAVKIKNSGEFDTLEISQILVKTYTDSSYYCASSDSNIQVDNLCKILKNNLWDEINISSPDVSILSFEFDFVEMKLTNQKFSEYINKENERNKNSIPCLK